MPIHTNFFLKFAPNKNQTIITMAKSIISVLIGLIVISCVSCTNQPSAPATGTKESSSVETTIRHIPFSGEFTQITNMGSVNIVYTTGPCDIRVEGPKALVQMVSAEIDCGILLLTVASERNQDIQQYQTIRSDLTAYISSPSLSMLAVCGSGSFISHDLITTEDIHIGTLRNGSILINSLICRNLRYEINGTSRDSIGHLTCDDALVVSSASGRLTMPDVNASGSLTLDDNVSSEILCKGKTTSLVINNQGRGLISFEGTFSQKNIHQGKDARVIIR